MRVLTPPELVWLLAAVAKADRAAFEQLYAATCAKLYGVVLRILRRKDLADEVIQDTYLQIWSSAGQFDPAIATPITWAAAIARNHAIDHIRKKSEVSIEDESDATDVVTETVDPAGQQTTEELKRLLACMGKLDAERQRLVLLAYYSGWTRQQLAAKLDKPVHTVKTWLQGSLAEIGERLGSTSEEAQNNEPLVVEYVLGTLDAYERPEAQALLETNAVFAARAHYWERRLGELNSMVQAVEPPAETWQKIAARMEGVAASEKFVLPNIEQPAAPRKYNIIDVVRRLRYWREGTIITGTVAATLAGLVVTSTVAPDAMPAPLRPKPHVVQVVKTEVVKSEVPARFVAVLQQNTSPAFILTVDIEGRSLTVRRVAADPQPGKSYELWLLSDRFPTPQSLGVVGDTDFAVDSKLSAYDAATITGATYAVSLEPEGGSPTGVAAGPILWTGRLVQALPGARRPLSQR